eukprot:scaffold2640_cov180-Amphora_coffeaeformis.AAC.8
MTSNNPLKEDPELKRLLQELDAIDSKKKFRRWRHSFLQQLAGYVDEAHVKPAESKYQEFTHCMGRMSTLVKKLYSHLEVGDLSEARTTVRAHKCLSDLQQAMEHVNNHLFGMLPKTAEQEKDLGYSKFHLGAVLVRDGFVEYDRLVVCDEILQHMAANGLQQIADRHILDNMVHYHNRLEQYSKKLGSALLVWLSKCRELLKQDDVDDQDDDDDDDDDATSFANSECGKEETPPVEETQRHPTPPVEVPTPLQKAMRRASTGCMPSGNKIPSSPNKAATSPTKTPPKFTVTLKETTTSPSKKAATVTKADATPSIQNTPVTTHSFGNYYHGNSNDWRIAATLRKEKKAKQASSETQNKKDTVTPSKSNKNKPAATIRTCAPSNEEPKQYTSPTRKHPRESGDSSGLTCMSVDGPNVLQVDEAPDEDERLGMGSAHATNAPEMSRENNAKETESDSDSSSEPDSSSESDSSSNSDSSSEPDSSDSHSVDLSVVSKEWEPVLGRAGPNGCPKAYQGMLDESLNKSGHGASPRNRRRGQKKKNAEQGKFGPNAGPATKHSHKTSPTGGAGVKTGPRVHDATPSKNDSNQLDSRASDEADLRTPNTTSDSRMSKARAVNDEMVSFPGTALPEGSDRDRFSAPGGSDSEKSSRSPILGASGASTQKRNGSADNKASEAPAASPQAQTKSEDSMSGSPTSTGDTKSPVDAMFFDDEHFGFSVDLSSEGTIMAAGSPGHGRGAKGRVQVFYWDEDDGDWALLGQAIFGNKFGDVSGASVALSHDGRILAVGSPQLKQADKPGYVRVYRYKEDNNYWDPIGPAIHGDEAGECFGWSVSLSGNGHRLVVGGPKNDNQSGAVRIFQYDNTKNTWKQLGKDVKGTKMGSSVAVSANGRFAASGCGIKGNRKNTEYFQCT